MSTTSPIIRSLSQIISMIDRGNFERSANEGMKEAIEAVRNEPGGKGKATITLELEIAVQGEMVQFRPKLKCKLPDGQSYAPLVLWGTEDGALSTQHPSQLGMFNEEHKEVVRPMTGGAQQTG